MEIKEDFCGACVAVPLAFAGVGASAYGSSSKGKHKQRKKIALITGGVSILLSVLIVVYYLYIRKCATCR